MSEVNAAILTVVATQGFIGHSLFFTKSASSPINVYEGHVTMSSPPGKYLTYINLVPDSHSGKSACSLCSLASKARKAANCSGGPRSLLLPLRYQEAKMPGPIKAV